jgi:hypothetical protein
MLKLRLFLCAGALLIASPSAAELTADDAPTAGVVPAQQVIDDLVKRLAASEARIALLEQKLGAQPVHDAALPAMPQETAAAVETGAQPNLHDHDLMMTLPGGPQLKISGFADINFGTGTVANPLIYPLPTTSKSAFQLGELDLFMTSHLAAHWDFVGEVAVGAGQSNEVGLDMERLQLTYKPSEYFSISAGRFHSAIGYYNTAFHHGTWFQTAEGRPFMYLFEDSGGILPVHNVGVTTTGLVPHMESLGLHWVAEVGNGRATSNAGQPVQNFVSDRNRKSVNFAAYIQPAAVPGLQIGGSFYLDRLAPISPEPRVSQRISSVYAVFSTPKWEFLNEAVLLSNVLPSGQSFNTPLAYTQVARKFGIYHPYFRYQYVNVPAADPVNVFTGRYDGPSVGLRIDATDYAAFKIQYNRIFMRQPEAANGLNAQLSFAF